MPRTEKNDLKENGLRRAPGTIAMITLCLTAVACSSEVTGTAAPAPAPANGAILDAEETATVTTGARAALESVFTIDPANPVPSEQAVDRHLTGQAAAKVRELTTEAKAASSTVTTTVTTLAVAELEPHRATLVAYLTQTGSQNGTSAPALAAVTVVATRAAGQWRLSELHAPLELPVARSAADGAAADRDAAVAAGRSAAAELTTISPESPPDATIDRWMGVSTGRLRADYEHRDHLRAQLANGSSSTSRATAAAAVEFDPATGKAVVLAPVDVVTTTPNAAPAQRLLALRLSLAREGAEWKAEGLETVQPAP